MLMDPGARLIPVCYSSWAERMGLVQAVAKHPAPSTQNDDQASGQNNEYAEAQAEILDEVQTAENYDQSNLADLGEDAQGHLGRVVPGEVSMETTGDGEDSGDEMMTDDEYLQVARRELPEGTEMHWGLLGRPVLFESPQDFSWAA